MKQAERNDGTGSKPGLSRRTVLFFCACNAIRSQMAEGILKTTFGDRYEATSAGLKPTRLSPLATRVMAEMGIDISGHEAKGIEAVAGTRFDYIALVCGDPRGDCPFLPRGGEQFICAGCSGCCTLHPLFPAGVRLLHARFQNLTDLEGEEHLDLYRRVRDEIKAWIEETFGPEGAF